MCVIPSQFAETEKLFGIDLQLRFSAQVKPAALAADHNNEVTFAQRSSPRDKRHTAIVVA